jgi:hypothetical protein
VDVKVTKDKIVRIEVTEGDDPLIICKAFQRAHNLSNEAAGALQKLLIYNFDSEMNRKKASQKSL